MPTAASTTGTSDLDPSEEDEHDDDDDDDVNADANDQRCRRANDATLAALQKAHPDTLTQVTFQEASGAVCSDATPSRIVENPTTNRAWNCFFCDYPLRRQGYMKQPMRLAMQELGYDVDAVLDLMEKKYMPLRGPPVCVPEGRALNVHTATSTKTANMNGANVGVEVCMHNCSLAQLYHDRNSNMNQCVALATIQAVQDGVCVDDLMPTPARGRLRRFGGVMDYKDQQQAIARKECSQRISNVCFQRVHQTYEVHHFNPTHAHQRTNRLTPPASSSSSSSGDVDDAAAVDDDTTHPRMGINTSTLQLEPWTEPIHPTPAPPPPAPETEAVTALDESVRDVVEGALMPPLPKDFLQSITPHDTPVFDPPLPPGPPPTGSPSQAMQDFTPQPPTSPPSPLPQSPPKKRKSRRTPQPPTSPPPPLPQSPPKKRKSRRTPRTGSGARRPAKKQPRLTATFGAATKRKSSSSKTKTTAAAAAAKRRSSSARKRRSVGQEARATARREAIMKQMLGT